MNPTAMFIAGLVILPAVGLVSWAWFAMAQVEEELRSFSDSKGCILWPVAAQAP